MVFDTQRLSEACNRMLAAQDGSATWSWVATTTLLTERLGTPYAFDARSKEAWSLTPENLVQLYHPWPVRLGQDTFSADRGGEYRGWSGPEAACGGPSHKRPDEAGRSASFSKHDRVQALCRMRSARDDSATESLTQTRSQTRWGELRIWTPRPNHFTLHCFEGTWVRATRRIGET